MAKFHRDDFTVVLQPFMEKVESPRKVKKNVIITKAHYQTQ